MKKFTTLASSLTTSSIWSEDDQTRIVWITMLTICDDQGVVEASVVGLAHVSRVTPEACARAIEKLQAPDPTSRLDAYDGKRIEKIEGGWRIINYFHYREISRLEIRREYMAERKRESRERAKTKPAPPRLEFKFPPELDTENFRKAWGEWVLFRRSKGLKSGNWQMLFDKQLEWLAAFPPHYAITVLDQSIRNGWTGLFMPKDNPLPQQRNTIVGRKTISQQERDRMERDSMDAQKLREELEARSPIKNIEDPFE